MGWYYSNGINRRHLTQEITQDWEGQSPRHPNVFATSKAIKRCYRGNAYRGVLWVVHELTTQWQKSFPVECSVGKPKVERWIGCYLMAYDKSCRGWGYKPMEESMHPYYYSCPLSYLELADGGIHDEWRRLVVQYHEGKNLKRQLKKALA